MLPKCRACLKSARKMAPFDEKYIMYFNILTNLNLMLSTDDPELLCKHCKKSLQQFIDFREQCIAANIAFTEDALKEEVKLELEVENDNVIEIKKELTDDDSEVDNALIYDDNVTYELVVKTEEGNKESESINVIIRKNECVKENINIPSAKKKKDKIIIKPTRNKKCVKAIKKNMTSVEKIFELKKNEEPADNGIPCEKKLEIKKIEEPSVKSLPCGLCTKSYEDNNELQSHLLKHRQYNSCSICDEKFLDWQELMSHRLVHLPVKKLQCHLCPKKFKTPLHLEHHFRLNHYSEGDRQTLRCRICNRNYGTPKRVRVHINGTHNIRNKQFYCDYCNKSCSTKSSLKSHIISHLDIKPYNCNLCGAAFKLSQQLSSHKIFKHTPDRVYCTMCKRVFVCKSALDKHVCKQSEVVCPVCGKIFKNPSAINRHILMHDKNRSYKCDRCPATYKSRPALAVHKNKHDGIRKYACEFCPAKFYFCSVLIKHRRTHTGIKPFVCEICEKAFTGGHNLKVHMQVHGKFLINKKQPNVLSLLKQEAGE